MPKQPEPRSKNGAPRSVTPSGSTITTRVSSAVCTPGAFLTTTRASISWPGTRFAPATSRLTLSAAGAPPPPPPPPPLPVGGGAAGVATSAGREALPRLPAGIEGPNHVGVRRAPGHGGVGPREQVRRRNERSTPVDAVGDRGRVVCDGSPLNIDPERILPCDSGGSGWCGRRRVVPARATTLQRVAVDRASGRGRERRARNAAAEGLGVRSAQSAPDCQPARRGSSASRKLRIPPTARLAGGEPRRVENLGALVGCERSRPAAAASRALHPRRERERGRTFSVPGVCTGLGRIDRRSGSPLRGTRSWADRPAALRRAAAARCRRTRARGSLISLFQSPMPDRRRPDVSSSTAARRVPAGTGGSATPSSSGVRPAARAVGVADLADERAGRVRAGVVVAGRGEREPENARGRAPPRARRRSSGRAAPRTRREQAMTHRRRSAGSRTGACWARSRSRRRGSRRSARERRGRSRSTCRAMPRHAAPRFPLCRRRRGTPADRSTAATARSSRVISAASSCVWPSVHCVVSRIAVAPSARAGSVAWVPISFGRSSAKPTRNGVGALRRCGLTHRAGQRRCSADEDRSGEAADLVAVRGDAWLSSPIGASSGYCASRLPLLQPPHAEGVVAAS